MTKLIGWKGVSVVGPWHKPMVDLVVRDHAVNDSALPQIETMQMRCCVRHAYC